MIIVRRREKEKEAQRAVFPVFVSLLKLLRAVSLLTYIRKDKDQQRIVKHILYLGSTLRLNLFFYLNVSSIASII